MLRDALPDVVGGLETGLAASTTLPRLSRAASALRRHLLGRDRLRLHGALQDVEFDWCLPTSAPTGLLLRLQAGPALFECGLHDPLAWGLRSDALHPSVPQVLRGSLIAQHAGAALAAVAEVVGVPVKLLDAHIAPSPPDEPAMGFRLRARDGRRLDGWLRALDEPGAQWLVRTTKALVPALPPTSWPLPCRALLGTSVMGLDDLAALACGDIVLILDRDLRGDGLACVLAVGDNRRPFAQAVIGREGLQVVAPNANKEDWMEPTVGNLPPPSAIELPIRFELAPWRATLAELGALAVGSVIETHENLRHAAVSVWVDRRCIATGRLVAVGERLGVRIDDLADDPAALPSGDAAAPPERP